MTADETSKSANRQSAPTLRATEAAKRKERLEAEMRANLQKRKQQIRNRKAKTRTGGHGDGSDNVGT